MDIRMIFGWYSGDIRMIFGLYGDGGIAERRRRKAPMRRQRTRIEGRRFGGAGQIEIQWTDRRRWGWYSDDGGWCRKGRIMKRRAPRCYVWSRVDDGRLRGVRWMVAAEDVIDYYRPWWSKIKNEWQTNCAAALQRWSLPSSSRPKLKATRQIEILHRSYLWYKLA